MNLSESGRLQISVFQINGAKPIKDAKIVISKKGEQNKVIEVLQTDISGQSPVVTLNAPNKQYSENPNSNIKPYEEYTAIIDAYGYDKKVIEGIQILPDSKAIQKISLEEKKVIDEIKIKEHTLWETYPSKIPEEEVKDIKKETGFVVLDKPVIPEFVVVHNGKPIENSKNLWIPFKDYIKNVACSEIYSTWPEETIKANVLAILSFTLNRVYTEWYRNKGYNFTITSSPAYDQFFNYGRTIYENISNIVDSTFTSYITKENIRQPLLSQYCNGTTSTCPTWLSQWGSKYLGDKGYSAINILKNYYGSDVFLKQAEKVSGVPVSYSGEVLQTGSKGPNVKTIQNQLNTISNNYPAIKKVKEDGIYGAGTREAVETFQKAFNLPVTGTVGFSTWYKISDVYVAVTKMSNP